MGRSSCKVGSTSKAAHGADIMARVGKDPIWTGMVLLKLGEVIGCSFGKDIRITGMEYLV